MLLNTENFCFIVCLFLFDCVFVCLLGCLFVVVVFCLFFS